MYKCYFLKKKKYNVAPLLAIFESKKDKQKKR